MVMLSITAALLAAANAAPVTVEIVASGHVETPADRYRITGGLLACAATQAEADAELARKSAAVARTMAGLGVVKSVAEEKPTLAGMMGAMAGTRGSGACMLTTVGLDAAKGEKKPAPEIGASAPVSYDAPDRATALRAIAALKAADAKPSDKILPVLLDDTNARRAAKQQALAKARIEANAYARPLGLNGASLVKISERQDLGSFDFVAQMLRTIGLSEATASDKVATDVTLTVEFRLGE